MLPKQIDFVVSQNTVEMIDYEKTNAMEILYKIVNNVY